MNYSKRSWLRLAVSFAVMGIPLAVRGQDSPAPRDPEANSKYATEEPLNDGVAFELHSVSSWDDNILGNNARRISDYVFEEGGLLGIFTTRPTWRLGLEYRPNALVDRDYGALNQLDQRLDFNNEFHLTRHLILRLKDGLDYATGVLEPQANGELSLPGGGPSPLNATVLTPFARQFANEASGEAEYDLSHRTSFQLSGGHGFRRFTNIGSATTTLSPASGLFNTKNDFGRASYSYRVTRHFTAGLEYAFQDMRFSQSFYDKTHSAFVRALWEVSPYFTLSAFGGPEYSDSGGQFLVPSTNPGQPGNVLTTAKGKQWSPAAGGAVTLRSDQTVLRLTAQRIVADGGGLLPAVTNSYESAEIRRRLTGSWDLALTASNARSLALEGPVGKGKVDTQGAGIALEHPLVRELSLHLGYNYFRQRSNQFVPFGLDADRDRYTVGLFYRARGYRAASERANPDPDANR